MASRGTSSQQRRTKAYGKGRRLVEGERSSNNFSTGAVTIEKLSIDGKSPRNKLIPLSIAGASRARPNAKTLSTSEEERGNKRLENAKFHEDVARPKSQFAPSAVGRASTHQKSKSPNKNAASTVVQRLEPFSAKERQVKKGLKSKKRDMVSESVISPRNYTVKPIIPAQKAEVIDVARAMHRDKFASRVKKLFDPEREAAMQAIETGIYVGWRCLGNDFDCIRVSENSRCFCGHVMLDHESFAAKRKQNLACLNCTCKQFEFIPSRPEEIGEWWLQKRPGFDVTTWRAKCRCKHTHEEHDKNANRKCKIRGCPCFAFDSNFLCAACDKHWEDHETCFDDTESRRLKNLPYGEEYLPFHELPQLRNIVLTGKEDDDSPYNALISGPYAIPRSKPTDLALRLQGKKDAS